MYYRSARFALVTVGRRADIVVGQWHVHLNKGTPTSVTIILGWVNNATNRQVITMADPAP